MSGKGGVGKSMVTALLATLSRRIGKSVGVLDGDIIGASMAKSFGIKKKLWGATRAYFLPKPSRVSKSCQ